MTETKIKIGCGDIIFREEKHRDGVKILFTQLYYSEDFILTIDAAQNCCEDFSIYDNLTKRELTTDVVNTMEEIYHDAGELIIKQIEIDGEDAINVEFSCGEKCIINIDITNIHNGYYPHFVRLEKITRKELFEEWI